MALTDIINKILDEAKNKATKLQQSADQELESYKAAQKAEFVQQEEELEKKAILKKKSIDRKMKTMVKMEERNQILKVKQKLIHEVFDQAVEKVSQMPDAEYEKLLEQLMKASSLSEYESGTLVPARGKKQITQQLATQLAPNLTVAEEGDFRGGFVFRSKKMELISTIEEIILNNLKPEIESEVAKLLF